jgi:hypothetical protein
MKNIKIVFVSIYDLLKLLPRQFLGLYILLFQLPNAMYICLPICWLIDEQNLMDQVKYRYSKNQQMQIH